VTHLAETLRKIGVLVIGCDGMGCGSDPEKGDASWRTLEDERGMEDVIAETYRRDETREG
jgi:hypothetical protein